MSERPRPPRLPALYRPTFISLITDGLKPRNNLSLLCPISFCAVSTIILPFLDLEAILPRDEDDESAADDFELKLSILATVEFVLALDAMLALLLDRLMTSCDWSVMTSSDLRILLLNLMLVFPMFGDEHPFLCGLAAALFTSEDWGFPRYLKIRSLLSFEGLATPLHELRFVKLCTSTAAGIGTLSCSGKDADRPSS